MLKLINLKIRNALPEDLDSIAHIEATCFPATEAAPRSVLKKRIAIFPKGFFVAELDNEVIGFINGGLTNSNHVEDDFFKTMDLHMPTGKKLVIFGLDVHPKYQRKGYAKELMKHFIEVARKDRRNTILLTCKEPLRKYYEQFGFIDKGISISQHGGSVWYEMYLELE